MKRRDFFKTVGVTTSGLALSGYLKGSTNRVTVKTKKPNIVFLFGDQHRAQSWSSLNPQLFTPNLERMAKEGVVFRNCISNFPLCSPYRASLLTGQYPQTNGVLKNINQKEDNLIPTDTKTIAECLRENGYSTAYIGKWHLYARDGNQGNNPTPYLVPPGPHRHGFEHWRVCYNYTRRYDTRYLDESGKERVLPEYAPKSQMDLAFEFIEANKDKPFCVFVSWHPPHPPYPEAPERFAKHYKDLKLKFRPNVPQEKLNEKLIQDSKGYYAHISALDDEVGRTIAKLNELGIDNNTIIVYTSDHGDMLGSHGEMGKERPYEESIGVPFFIRWPDGVPRGKNLDTLFSTVDIAPTLLSLTGTPAPSSMEGTDISGILRGSKEREGQDSVFIMSSSWRGVRTKQYTYVIEGKEPKMMYDNLKDPYQMKNILGEEDYVPIRQDLQKKLDGWLKKFDK